MRVPITSNFSSLLCCAFWIQEVHDVLCQSNSTHEGQAGSDGRVSDQFVCGDRCGVCLRARNLCPDSNRVDQSRMSIQSGELVDN